MNNRSLFRLLLALSLAAGLRAQSYTFSTFASTYLYPTGIAIDAAGNVFVAGQSNNAIYKFTASGAGSIVYGSTTSNSGSSDGTGTAATFRSPRALAFDTSGNLYLTDTGNHTIRKITPAGVVTTLAGSPLSTGTSDGTGSAARFNGPSGLAVDSAGNLFVADTGNHIIRKVTPAGVVTTFAGLAGTAGGADGTGDAARFSSPRGLAFDTSGRLYVADTYNQAIRRISAGGEVTTIAGRLGNYGSVDGQGPAARFSNPNGLVVDPAGNVFVADTSNNTIRKIAPNGAVTTLGGQTGFGGDASGLGNAAKFYGPRTVALDASGNLYVADYYFVKLGASSSQLAITVQPQSLPAGAGSTASFSVTATGAAPLSYQWQKNGSAIAGATGSTLTLRAVTSADAATYTVTVTNPVGTLASSGATLTVVAAVPNDDFANAQVLLGASGSASGSNNGATGEVNEPTHIFPGATASSVWYKWTPTDSGTAIFTFSSNTVVACVYTGASLDTLTCVANIGYSRINFPAQAGTTYYLAIGSYPSGPRGNFSFGWRMLFNDDFANAQAITGSSGSVAGNNDGATNEVGEPTNPRPPTGSVWYRWTPTQTGTVLLDVNNGWDTAVYTGTSLTSLAVVSPSPVSGISSSGTSLQRRFFNVQAGTTYSIAVGTSYSYYSSGNFTLSWQTTVLPVFAAPPTVALNGSTSGSSIATIPTGGSAIFSSGIVVSATPASYQWSRNGTPISGATNSALTIASAQSTDTGNYTVTVSNAGGAATSNSVVVTIIVPPPNDNFANAAAITGLTGSTTGTNVNASGEPGEPAHWNLSGTASSVWYKWTPTASGLAAIDTVGSSFDTVMAVYTGPTDGTAATLTNLTRLTQDDDRGGGRTSLVNFAATGGTTYYIAVGGSTSGARGNLTLNWQLTAVLAVTTPPANQTVAAGGSATFSVSASGTGLTYQWNRNGTAIPGATSATLTVSSVQTGADASYTVTITNASGARVTSDPATLSVAAPALTNFTIRNTKQDAGMLWSIAANGDTLVACGDAGVIISSTDRGRTWAPRVSGNTAWLVAVTFGGGQFVIVGEGGRILTSADGTNWTSVTATGTSERLNNVIFADGKYVAIGEHGTCVTSTDAKVWTPRTTPVTSWLHGLAYNASIGQFATAGENAVFLYSADAITWNRLPVPGYSGNLHHIAAVDGYAHFVVVGDLGKAVSVRQNQLVLKDGQPLTTWTADVYSTNTTKTLIGLVQAAGALFAMSEDGQIITANQDRGPWVSLSSPAKSYLTAGLYHQDTLYIVGLNEMVLQSDPIYLSRLRNISTRGQVGTGGDIMISGFIVRGDGPKQVLVRAAGPALAAFGVTGTLAAPVLTVLDSKAATLATNTGWSTGTAVNTAAITATAARVSAFPFAAGSADSALIATLNPGEYTVQVAGANNTNGICLVEVYDTDVIDNGGSHAVNISTRGLSGAGASKMIAGFIIEGAAARRVLIRAVGPGLAQFGVTGTLAEPTLEVYNARGLLHASAGAWGLQPNADEIRAAFDAGGAFKLAEGSKDSAMVIALPPGNWTVQVGGSGAANGVAIIEVYALP